MWRPFFPTTIDGGEGSLEERRKFWKTRSITAFTWGGSTDVDGLLPLSATSSFTRLTSHQSRMQSGSLYSISRHSSVAEGVSVATAVARFRRTRWRCSCSPNARVPGITHTHVVQDCTPALRDEFALTR